MMLSERSGIIYRCINQRKLDEFDYKNNNTLVNSIDISLNNNKPKHHQKY